MCYGLYPYRTFYSCISLKWGVENGIYIETERLKLRDWKQEDLLPFQKMNANPQVRRYFPSLLSYRRSELDMKKWMTLLKKTV